MKGLQKRIDIQNNKFIDFLEVIGTDELEKINYANLSVRSEESGKVGVTLLGGDEEIINLVTTAMRNSDGFKSIIYKCAVASLMEVDELSPEHWTPRLVLEMMEMIK